MSTAIPVTVLTGYLGAGKTTLLNRILSEDHGRRYAVIVNEFGEIGIDHDLILNADEELFEMNNGCICCTVRGDLVRTLHSLLSREASVGKPFDAIIVETTGLADPGPVAQTFFVDPFLQQRTRLDSITTIVDAAHVLEQIKTSREAAEQIAFADQIVINKMFQVSLITIAKIEVAVRKLNPLAPIHCTERAKVNIADLLGLGGFDLDRIVSLEPQFLAPLVSDTPHEHDEHCEHDHSHDSDIGSVSLRSDTPMDRTLVSAWLTALVAARGQDILRAKGIVDISDEPRRMVFQAVHMLLEGDLQKVWRANEPRFSRLVFIGRHLDGASLQAGFDACVAVPALSTRQPLPVLPT